MSRLVAANRILNTIRIFSRSGCAWSGDQLNQSRPTQRLFKMEACSGERQMSTEEPRRFARPDEVDYALKQDMGKGYTRSTVEISALGTKYNMVYGEWVPVDRPVEGCPAVICIHGTPATEGAFRPIGSRIAQNGYRVLAVNLPGMGYTQNDPERRYNYTTPNKVDLVKAFITALQLDSVAMVIGHSLGSHVVGALAADPELEGIVQSACFLCGTGLTPHKLYEKINSPILGHLLYKIMYLPIIGWLVTYIFAKFVHRAGFRGRTDEAQALCIYEVTHMKFDVFAQHVMRIAVRRLPVLLFYSFDDIVVESERLQDNIDVLGIPDTDIKDYDADGLSDHIYEDGTLRRVVRFAAGTHRLQFTNPERTTAEIVSLLDALGKR